MRTALVLLVLAAACYTGPREVSPQNPVLCVRNAGFGPVTVYDRLGRWISMISPDGRWVCRSFRDAHAAQQLGLRWHQHHFLVTPYPIIASQSDGCWVWELNGLDSHDAPGLVPEAGGETCRAH